MQQIVFGIQPFVWVGLGHAAGHKSPGKLTAAEHLAGCLPACIQCRNELVCRHVGIILARTLLWAGAQLLLVQSMGRLQGTALLLSNLEVLLSMQLVGSAVPDTSGHASPSPGHPAAVLHMQEDPAAAHSQVSQYLPAPRSAAVMMMAKASAAGSAARGDPAAEGVAIYLTAAERGAGWCLHI